MRLDSPPRVLITGAGRGVGNACADVLAARGAELILCDLDATALREAVEQFDAVGRFCDVASEASVAVFAADIVESFGSIDLLINAAGGGYERTLGMYRISRALLPALRRGAHFKLLLNIAPEEDPAVAIFPYASSDQAFQRLSAALAAETRGTGISVLVGCPATELVSQVAPDADAGHRADIYPFHGNAAAGDSLTAQVAALLGPTDWRSTSRHWAG
jgi:NAD(P)-dependent dehydrogenase (short-subunit alcohol dehydrogenase family)